MCEWPAVAGEAREGLVCVCEGRTIVACSTRAEKIVWSRLFAHSGDNLRGARLFPLAFRGTRHVARKEALWPLTRLPACFLPRPTTYPLSAKFPAEREPRKQPRESQSCRQKRGNCGGQAVPADGERWSQKLGQLVGKQRHTLLVRSDSGDVGEWKWGGCSKMFGISELYGFFIV